MDRLQLQPRREVLEFGLLNLHVLIPQLDTFSTLVRGPPPLSSCEATLLPNHSFSMMMLPRLDLTARPGALLAPALALYHMDPGRQDSRWCQSGQG